MDLNDRQQTILEMVKQSEPMTSQEIADQLGLSRSAIRSDLSVLTMTGLLSAKPKVGYFYVKPENMGPLKDYLKTLQVDDLKSMPVMVDVNTSVYDAVVQLFMEDTGALIVTEGGHLAGVVSRKDLLKATVAGGDINNIPVGMIMTRMPNIVTVTPKSPAIEAIIKIIEHEIDGIPVVETVIVGGEEMYRVLGKVTKTSITRAIYELVR